MLSLRYFLTNDYCLIDRISLNVSQIYSFSFECLLSADGDTPRSVLATMLALFVPFMVIGIFFMYWLYDTCKLKKNWKHLVKRCILSFVSVLYVCYFSLAKTVFLALSCGRVFDGVSLGGQDVAHSYWKADTSVRCGEGSHAALMYWVGVPLVIFIWGYPIVTCIVLSVAQYRNALRSDWIRETFGVLFIGFRPTYE